jgi:IclR family transcriptional regulator, acetate operon repressor
MQNKPPYALNSVDHALRLAQILQAEGPLRLTDVAERLGVAPSTAHRLLAMLVYRDFAHKNDDRTYRSGFALRPLAPTDAPIPLLRDISTPYMQSLVERVDESANLVVLAGADARFIVTIECHRVLRVGDRVGRFLPAHITSGGKAILAALTREAVNERFREVDGIDLAKLHRELAQVRRRGYAINNQQTETGLTAIGIAISDATGVPCAAVCLAMPTARYNRDQLPHQIEALHETAQRIEADLERASETAS